MSASRPHPVHPVDGPECALGACPRCGSTLLQPHGWKEVSIDELLLHLRCAECQLWMVGNFEHSRVAAYDQEHIHARRLIEAEYATVVRRNMEDLAEQLSRCFELDLIGPDDFAPAARGQWLQSASEATT